jgi:hypothetical protein
LEQNTLTATYLHVDTREQDYWITEIEDNGVLVDLSDEFIQRYREAVDLYDGVQAELELIYKSKEV